jgi:hypothetical protein
LGFFSAWVNERAKIVARTHDIAVVLYAIRVASFAETATAVERKMRSGAVAYAEAAVAERKTRRRAKGENENEAHIAFAWCSPRSFCVPNWQNFEPEEFFSEIYPLKKLICRRKIKFTQNQET